MKKTMITTGTAFAMVLSLMGGTGVCAAEAEYTVGIEQFAEHGSLDNCREGFLEGLAEEGIVEGENLTVEYKNAAADMGTAGQISDSFVSADMDLLCGIATPSAQSCYNAAMDAEIPVIYTAVTDPEAAELVAEGKPVGEVTGTSDKLPVEKQLEMIRRCFRKQKISAFSTPQVRQIRSPRSRNMRLWPGSMVFRLYPRGSQPRQIFLLQRRRFWKKWTALQI